MDVDWLVGTTFPEPLLNEHTLVSLLNVAPEQVSVELQLVWQPLIDDPFNVLIVDSPINAELGIMLNEASFEFIADI